MLSPIFRVASSPWVFAAIRIFLGAVFIWASVPKILDPQGFAAILKNYQILPSALVNPVAVVLPWAEALCGLSLIFGRLIRGGALIFVILMSIFAGLTGFNIYRGLDVSCGCFSVAAKETYASHWVNMWRNLFLLLLGLFVLRRAGADDDRAVVRKKAKK